MFGNGSGQGLEVFVGADEVRFTVDFDDDTYLAVFGNVGNDSAFRRDTASLLGSLGEALSRR